MKITSTFIRRAALSSLLLCSPETAFAGAGWTAWSTIAEVIATDNNGMAVVLPDANNPVSCSSTTWYRLMPSVSNYEVIASTLMSAAAQGKQVQVWAQSCASDGASLIQGAWARM